MADVTEIKSKIALPTYFYSIIIPQRPDYYSDYAVDFDARPVAKCPLHDEDTPSFRYYSETNTFYCFGCRSGGDIIELHRKYYEHMSGYKPTFSEATNFLYNFFIKGKTTVSVVRNGSLKQEKKVSTPVEMIRYTTYISRLEQQVSLEASISLDKKVIIWEILDNIDSLVKLNMVNAIEAMNYIKQNIHKYL